MKARAISCFVLMAILIFGLFACNSGSQIPSVNPPPSVVSQQPTLALQTLADAATPTVQPTAVLSLSGNDCSNVYFPVYEGATWTYTQQGAAGSQAKVDTITDVGTDGFLVETTITDDKGTIDMVTTWKCTPEGLVMGQSDGGQFSAVSQGSGGEVTQTTLSISGVTMPSNLNPGDTWAQTTVVQVTSSVLNDTVTTVTEYKAIGSEHVTVPAGTFPAMRIDIHSLMTFETSGTMTQDLIEWVSPEVGVVKTVNGASFGEGPEASTTAELVSYNIP